MTVDEFIQLNPNWKSKSFKGKFDSIIVLPENIQFQFLKKIDFSKVDKIKIKFQFKNSFLVTEDGIISTKNGMFFTFNDLNNFKIEKPKGFLKVPIYYTNKGIEVDNLINHNDFEGEILRTFLSYLGGEFDSTERDIIKKITFPSFDKDEFLEIFFTSFEKHMSPVYMLTPSEIIDNIKFNMIEHMSLTRGLSWKDNGYDCYSKVTSIEKNTVQNRKILFGTKSGLIFVDQGIYFRGKYHDYPEYEFNYETFVDTFIDYISPLEIELFDRIMEDVVTFRDSKEQVRIKKLSERKQQIKEIFDKDNNGLIDDLEDKNDYSLILERNQETIYSKNPDYLHKLTKLKNYLELKKSNITSIYNRIDSEEYEFIIDNKLEPLLMNNLNFLNRVYVLSLSLISNLIEGKMLDFFKIYEVFDTLNIWESQWERDMKQQLVDINHNLIEILKSIEIMESQIVSSLSEIQINQTTIQNQLDTVNSNLDTQTMWSIVNTYQLYKINQNTKSLKE